MIAIFLYPKILCAIRASCCLCSRENGTSAKLLELDRVGRLYSTSKLDFISLFSHSFYQRTYLSYAEIMRFCREIRSFSFSHILGVIASSAPFSVFRLDASVLGRVQKYSRLSGQPFERIKRTITSSWVERRKAKRRHLCKHFAFRRKPTTLLKWPQNGTESSFSDGWRRARRRADSSSRISCVNLRR